MKTIAGSGLIFLLTAGVAFAQAKNPKVVVDQETGVILYRPSGEEWSCKKAGEGDDVFFGGTSVLAYHRIDGCGVQVYFNVKEDNQSFPQLKEMATNQVKRYGTDQGGQAIKGRKIVTKMNVSRKFPGAGRPNAQYVECVIDDSGRNGPKEIVRQYFFINKKNNNQAVIVTITGDAETYKKHQRKLFWIMAKMRIEKVRKKR